LRANRWQGDGRCSKTSLPVTSRAEAFFRLSPASRKLQDAHRWLASAGGGSDGVIAKHLDLALSRQPWRHVKIMRYRSADCVIGGFRYGENVQAGRKVVGSILLGLYDARACFIMWDFRRVSKPRTSRLSPTSLRR
jgi:hypothetical protein